MTDDNNDPLDKLFAAARSPDPQPSEALLTRVLADAETVHAQSRAGLTQMPVSGWRGLLDLLGGWPAVSGVAAAGVAGLWLGFAPPATVEDLAGGLLGNVTEVSILGELDAFELEDVSDG